MMRDTDDAIARARRSASTLANRVVMLLAPFRVRAVMIDTASAVALFRQRRRHTARPTASELHQSI